MLFKYSGNVWLYMYLQYISSDIYLVLEKRPLKKKKKMLNGGKVPLCTFEVSYT